MTKDESSGAEPDERPATWENIVEGEEKKLVGELTRNQRLVEQGEEEIEVAHEVRKEWREQEKHRHDDHH